MRSSVITASKPPGSARNAASAAVLDVNPVGRYPSSSSVRVASLTSGSSSSTISTRCPSPRGIRAAELGDDAVHQRESKPGTGAHLLGGEERIEDPVDDLARDPGASVGHREHDVLPGGDVANGRRAAGFGQLRLQQIERLAHHLFHGHGDALAHPAAAEREYAIDQQATALTRGHNAVEVAAQAAALGRIAQRHLAVAEDRPQDVVEVVRDAAGERAHRLQPLRLTQLPLEPLALRNVAPDAVVTLEAALCVEDRRAAHADIANGSVQRDPGILEITERVTRREHRLVLGPGARQERHAFKLPARLADRESSQISGRVIGLARQVREAQVLVLFPVPVGGELGQRAEARFALAQRLLDALALGDVAPDALVTLEAALAIENRRAADADIADRPVRVGTAVFKITEGLTRCKDRLVLGPGRGKRFGVAKLPTSLADHGLARVSIESIDPARQVRKAQVLVLPPVPVGRKLGKTAEARFALAQFLLGELALGDVADDAVEQDAAALGARRVHAVAHPAQGAVRPQDSILRILAVGGTRDDSLED